MDNFIEQMEGTRKRHPVQVNEDGFPIITQHRRNQSDGYVTDHEEEGGGDGGNINSEGKDKSGKISNSEADINSEKNVTSDENNNFEKTNISEENKNSEENSNSGVINNSEGNNVSGVIKNSEGNNGSVVINIFEEKSNSKENDNSDKNQNPTINNSEVDANALIEKLGDLKSFEFQNLPDILTRDDDDDDLEEGGGLTLPATPLDSPSDSEVDPFLMNREDEEDDDEYEFCLPQLSHATEQVEEFARKVWTAGWNCCHFRALPNWLQDNDFLVRGHRPPLPSVTECFKSIFRLHTETGNIWTHLLGCLAFVGVAVWFLTRPSLEIQLQEKLVFTAFFVGAISCLGLSFAFHTLHCHSEFVGKLFSKLDYVGIALLIMGSFFPWLYYGFYCEKSLQIFYFSVTFVLGFTSIIVSLWDKFGEPRYRPLRAGLFVGFGMSGVIPAVHYALAKGWIHAISKASLGWLILMGVLYVLGAVVYAVRIPERWFPGKCDIWFHSHQLFHVLVIAAAFVHYHGISQMAMHRLAHGECEDHPYEAITL